jgi:hypothetical protein
MNIVIESNVIEIILPHSSGIFPKEYLTIKTIFFEKV